MKLDNRKLDSVRVWSTANPDQVSRRFHNMLLHQVPELRTMLDLFATPLGQAVGPYQHHDGWRCL